MLNFISILFAFAINLLIAGVVLAFGVYLPFNMSNAQQIEIDPNIKTFLDSVNCQITDYRRGYCQIGKRTFRIGKLIEIEKDKELKELQKKHQAGQVFNLQREQQEIITYYNNLLQIFTNSSYRKSKNESQFQIVISQNPKDIATMSTGRARTVSNDDSRASTLQVQLSLDPIGK